MLPRILTWLKRLPGLEWAVSHERYRALRFRLTLALSRRCSRTFTAFLRRPRQMDLLAGPVLDALLDGRPGTEPVRIVIIGCSNGAEAYTVASVLKRRRPGMEFVVDGFDIDPDVLERARAATYGRDELPGEDPRRREFAERTFEPHGTRVRVRPEFSRHVRFAQADALDPGLAALVGRADVVLAQNFLFHLRPRAAGRAFDNICGLLRDRSALFVEGCDPVVRLRAVRRNRLVPLDHGIEALYREAWAERGTYYPYTYYGLAPFRRRGDWKRRHAMVFVRGLPAAPVASRPQVPAA